MTHSDVGHLYDDIITNVKVRQDLALDVSKSGSAKT
jgi:hypothetical protein